ncbi:MAG: pilus assembly protein PilM [Bdellovibrio sp.]|jgi:general secretion pathway protein L
MRAVGIDIGTSSIKVCEVQSTSKGVQILSFTEHPLGLNPAHDTELEVLEFLQGLALQYTNSQTKVVMALKQDRVSIRNKTFPFADRMKILKSLPFELEEDLPFSSETAIYEARTIRLLGNQAEVLAAASPKHRIAEFLQKYQSAGLDIDILTAEGLAFANCFSNWDGPIPQLPPAPIELNEDGGETPRTDRKLKLMIQIGHTHSIVCAFEGQALVGIRSVLWGMKNVSEAISRKYEIPFVEAMREMRSKAFILPNKEGASYDQIVFSDTIAVPFKDFGRELKLSMLEIETELGGKVLAAEVTGGGAGIMHLTPFLTQMLEVPVNPAQILTSFVTNFEKSQTVDHFIGTSLGLALEGLRKPRNPALQFLRGEFAATNESLRVFWETWSRTIACVASAILIFFVFSNLRESSAQSLLTKALDEVKNQAKIVARLGPKQANESGVKKYIRDKRKRAQELRSLEGLSRMNSALEVLKKISDSAPTRGSINLNIRFLRIEDTNVVLEGTVENAAQRTALQKALSSVAKTGQLNAREGTPATGVLGIPFAFGFDVDRGTEK